MKWTQLLAMIPVLWAFQAAWANPCPEDTERVMKTAMRKGHDNPEFRDATLKELWVQEERPGLVRMKLYAIKSTDCLPCPPKMKCQPCGSTVLVADKRSTPEDQALQLSASNVYDPKKPDYFYIELREGYKKWLSSRESDPRVLLNRSPIILLGCQRVE
jgi:hypothetical protein